MDTVSEFRAEVPQATASEGLAQGSYAVARARFESATLWTKGDKSTNEPPRPTMYNHASMFLTILHLNSYYDEVYYQQGLAYMYESVGHIYATYPAC